MRESTNRRFPGAGFKRQKKVTATTFYQARLAADALSCWRELGGATALATLGVIDKHLLENSIATISTSEGPSRLHQLCELMNLEAWVRRRL